MCRASVVCPIAIVRWLHAILGRALPGLPSLDRILHAIFPSLLSKKTACSHYAGGPCAVSSRSFFSFRLYRLPPQTVRVTRLRIRLRALTYLHHKTSPLSSIVLRAWITRPPTRPTSSAAHLCWSSKRGSRGCKVARYHSHPPSVLCTYQGSSDRRQGADYVLV